MQNIIFIIIIIITQLLTRYKNESQARKRIAGALYTIHYTPWMAPIEVF